MRLVFWLSHPRLLFHRLRYWLWERLEPGRPWLCPGTVRFCERHLEPSMRVLEFGSGRSTTWLAAMVGHVISIEHNEVWYRKVRETVAAKGQANVDLRHVPLDHPEAEGERADYDPMPAYVRVADGLIDASLDLVVVDGHYRSNCILRVAPKIRPGGLLLVDDANFWPALDAIPVPAGWSIIDDSSNGLKRCVIWQAN